MKAFRTQDEQQQRAGRRSQQTADSNSLVATCSSGQATR